LIAVFFTVGVLNQLSKDIFKCRAKQSIYFSCNVTVLTTGRNTVMAIYMDIPWHWVCENPMHTGTLSGQLNTM